MTLRTGTGIEMGLKYRTSIAAFIVAFVIAFDLVKILK